MPKHRATSDLDITAMEQSDMSQAVVESVVDDMWTIAAACSLDESAMEAVGLLGGYLNTLLNPDSPEASDVELISLGIQQWLREMVEPPEPLPDPLRPLAEEPAQLR